MRYLIICIIILSFNILLSAENLFEAKVYLQGSNREILLFNLHNSIEKDGKFTHLTHYYTTPDSILATVDKVTLENGKFKSAESHFYQVEESGMMFRKGSKMLMKYKKGEKRKQKNLDFPDNFLVGPLFNDYIVEKWDTLLNGERIVFKLPAPSLLRMIRFGFEIERESEYQKRGTVVFKLDANNILLNWLVNPSYFVYDNKEKRLLEIHGTSILKIQDGDEWTTSTDVEIYYEYR